jgi:hypothetical protein
MIILNDQLVIKLFLNLFFYTKEVKICQNDIQQILASFINKLYNPKLTF